MFSPFAHYLSYGATDQATARRLTGYYDGLLVPGTVAAFQRAGTGGFVLTLSATAASPQYVIDPRFPLFQQALRSPKKSHEALADLFGSPELVRPYNPSPADFSAELVERVAANWIDFNSGYTELARKSFDKYAARLGEPIEPANKRAPSYILAPYFIDRRDQAGWDLVSEALFVATRTAAAGDNVVRVVATDSPHRLDAYLQAIPEDRAAIWVSNLNEIMARSEDLAAYAAAIAHATAQGRQLFALYGGFFSVVLRAVGLCGKSHGIGYGESRDWVELPQSGPPPARYYLPLAHRYVSQDLAYQLWSRHRPLALCDCDVCDGDPPIALDYQGLMDHSVLCRAREIADWAGRDVAASIAALRHDFRIFLDGLDVAVLPAPVDALARRNVEHLRNWRLALESLP